MRGCRGSGFVFTMLRGFLQATYDALLGSWLWSLYRAGPLRLGFWRGLSDPEVCARLTPSSESTDWVTGTGEPTAGCKTMIDRDFRTFEVMVHTVLYAAAIVAAYHCLRQWCIARTQAKTAARVLYALQAATIATSAAPAGQDRRLKDKHAYAATEEDITEREQRGLSAPMTQF